MAAMETEAARDALAHDGVLPETLVFPVEASPAQLSGRSGQPPPQRQVDYNRTRQTMRWFTRSQRRRNGPGSEERLDAPIF